MWVVFEIIFGLNDVIFAKVLGLNGVIIWTANQNITAIPIHFTTGDDVMKNLGK